MKRGIYLVQLEIELFGCNGVRNTADLHIGGISPSTNIIVALDTGSILPRNRVLSISLMFFPAVFLTQTKPRNPTYLKLNPKDSTMKQPGIKSRLLVIKQPPFTLGINTKGVA